MIPAVVQDAANKTWIDWGYPATPETVHSPSILIPRDINSRTNSSGSTAIS